MQQQDNPIFVEDEQQQDYVDDPESEKFVEQPPPSNKIFTDFEEQIKNDKNLKLLHDTM